MFLQPRSHIYLALFIAMMLACGLYFIGREAKPLGFGTTAQTFWADELNDWYGTENWNNTVQAGDGAALSQIHSLYDIEPGYDYYLANRSDGRVLASNHKDIFIFEPARNLFRRYAIPFKWSDFREFLQSPDGKLYGIASAAVNDHLGAFADGQDRLFEFDPDTGQAQLITTLISTTRYIVADSHNHILGFRSGLWPDWMYDIDSAQFRSVETSDQIGLYWQNPPILGSDGLIYGTYLAYPSGQNIGAALDLDHHELITHELFGGWWPTIAARPGTGVYINSEYFGTWLFNPTANELISLTLPSSQPTSRFNIQVATPTGWLYGLDTGPNTKSVFAYQPEANRFKSFALANHEWINALIVGGDQQIYAIASTEGWGNPRLVVITDTYVSTGTLTTSSIRPIALVMTQTLVGNASTETRALTCDTNGRLAGVISQSSYRSGTLDRGWLFTYNPHAVTSTVQYVTPSISDENRGQFLGGTALVKLPDGRLTGGTNNGHIFVYDPATDQTLDVGKPTTSTARITTLITHSNGLIYGGTFAYRAPGTLFEFDPAHNTLASIQTPLTQTYSIDALSVAPNGSIYIGAPQNLLLFMPTTRQFAVLHHFKQWCSIHALLVHPNGKLYGGCGANLFSYDPSNGVVTELGAAATGIEGNIAAVILGNDGRVYGSLDFKYTNGHIFVYDPLTSRLSDLGIALPTGVTALTTCGDGTIFGGTGTTDSFYTGVSYLFAFRTDCISGPVGSWDRLTWEADTPPSTNLTVDVLDEQGEVLLSQVSNGGSLQSIAAQQHPAIRLRANLSTFDPHVTPILKRWRVDYTFACQK